MKHRITTWALIVALGITGAAIYAPSAQAASYVSGKCGIHRGRIVFPYKHVYHVRIGPKNGRVGGSHRCRGVAARKGSGATNGVLSWSPFDFPRVNWHTIIDVSRTAGLTTVSCAGFGGGLAGEIGFGFDTAITVAAGYGCVTGGVSLAHQVNDIFPVRK